MYDELLNKNNSDYLQNIEYVLNNLCNDTKEELIRLFGKKYFVNTFEIIDNTEIHIIKLEKNNEPVGLYGIIPQSETSAGIYLLTTDNLHKGNIFKFLRTAKKQVSVWSKKYKLLMDNLYKKNKTIMKWLLLLGFKPSEHENENFQIYYIGDINEYN